jgi:hypothetical protein
VFFRKCGECEHVRLVLVDEMWKCHNAREKEFRNVKIVCTVSSFPICHSTSQQHYGELVQCTQNTEGLFLQILVREQIHRNGDISFFKVLIGLSFWIHSYVPLSSH